MITIHWDFTDGTELSYIDGLLADDNFTTHCLEFFNMNEPVDEVVVVSKCGKKISRNNINEHTRKDIRPSHDIRKMLIAGSFDWL